ncbi:hypothetical protein LHYA1_G007946 [Lachnellula hyalina]|uniref:Uncharacterized protein n=1 Tax=Lachnellula hyalina TaxID=1316788 RepID=A0A8H8QWZ4_9HELO|nr:uncharacterized protein LHYA1_G007946 [Lachnellula hyalina]TVY23265.1 hypothetical protein LHYA1_G007946 [Lachnellula hyalina]
MAVIVIVRATYTEERTLETFFTQIFGWGKSTILWKRGRFQCTIPRQLRADEVTRLTEAAQVEHYEPGS